MGFDNLSLYPDIFLGPAIDLARDDEIDDALEVALAQYEFISVSRLSFEQSLRLQRREQYSLAAEYSSISLDTWRIHFDGASEESLAVARPTELRILNTAAVHNFNKGDYNATIDLIQQARRLAALMPPTPLLASTEWNTALMERWRGDYSKALQHAQTALQIYHATNASPLNIARLQLFIAQIANDCSGDAAARGATQLVDHNLRLAKRHLNAARPPANSRHSPAIEGSFRLIYSAYSRLSGKNEDRVGMLESIAHLAQALHDPLLKGQTFTALGDEFSFQRRTGEAQMCYEIAFETLDSSQAPSFSVWPLRHLRQN